MANTKILVQENQAAFNEFLTAKQPSVVYFQNPAAGTPVPQGMTIEVRVFSPSDVPLGAVLEGVPPALGLLMLEDVDELIRNDPTVNEVSMSGTLDPGKEAAFIDAFNQRAQGRGSTTTIPASEAQNVMLLMKNNGLFLRR